MNLEVLRLKIDVSCVHDVRPALGLLGTVGVQPSCFSPFCGALRRNNFRLCCHTESFSLSAQSPFSSNPVSGSLAEVRTCLLWLQIALYFLSEITLPASSPFPPCSVSIPHSPRESLVFLGSAATFGYLPCPSEVV